MNPVDIVALITRSSGFLFSPPPDLPFNTNEREFSIIIPVQNLNITENFKIGNVEFYQNFDTSDDLLIQNSNTQRNNPFWNENFPRAKTIVKSTNFFDAITNGYSNISRSIDLIALRTDLSFPSITIDSTQYNLEFDRNTLLSRVKIPTCVYCHELNSLAITFFDFDSIIERKLILKENAHQFFNQVNILFDDLIKKRNPSLDEKNLLLTLRWLRKAIQDGDNNDNNDKFLALWVVAEFLISGETPKKMFTKNERGKLKNLINSTDFDSKQKEVLISKICKLNDSPFMATFEQLIQKLGISFSEDELKVFKQLRIKRTHLVHGKEDISIDNNELNKMRTILEKIFIGKINALKYPSERDRDNIST